MLSLQIYRRDIYRRRDRDRRPQPGLHHGRHLPGVQGYTYRTTKVFEGENGFTKNGSGWSRRTFTIPGAALQRSNTLIIQNIEESDRASGPPFFMLNYAVLRKTK